MKLFLLVFLSSLCVLAVEPLKLSSVGLGKDIKILAEIEIPKGQKLNKAAPSNITVYEKIKNEWVVAEKINLNNYFLANEKFNFEVSANLKENNSELKIDASLYHCDKIKNNYCVIDDFEGLVKRKKSMSTRSLAINLKGTNPR